MGARLGIKLLLAGLLCGLVAFGFRQYGNARVQEDRAETLTKAAAESVVASSNAVRADAQVALKKRASDDSVRSAVRPVRRFHVQRSVPKDSGEVSEAGSGIPDPVCGPVFGSVLNAAIDEANLAITSSDLP